MDKNKINDLNSLLTEAEVDAKLNSLLKSLEEELEAEGTEDREPEEVDAAKVDIEPVGTEDEKKAEDISAEVNEAAVSEEVLEPNASTVDAVAQGVAGDGIASPVVGSNIENEDETKIDTETEVKPDGTIEVEVEVKPEDEEVVDTTEVEKRAIDIDPLKVVEEELSSIFAILKGQTLTESEGEEAVKDGEQDIEDAAKKDVDVVEFKNEKDTADDENDSEGQAHEIKVDSDATEDKKEPESDGEKVADELADELEAGMVKEELEAEGTEDREPKEATAAQMEVEPVGTDEGEEAEDIDETVNEEYIDNVLEEALKDIIEDATKRGKAKKRIRTAFRANADKYDLIKKQGLLSDEGMNAYESLTDEEKKEYHKFSNSGIKELKKVYDKKKNIELSKIKADRSRKKLESLKEAFEAGSAYYSTPERVQELQEMIAVSLAKENNDILFQEMSKCTQLAESFKNRLLHKYSIISENRTAEFLQSILESEACMDAVKDEMPEEVDADKLNVSPVGSEDEKKAEDIDVESLEESLTDFELLQVLDESGYEPSLENLSILKEYLLNEGKLKKALTAAAIGTGLVLGGASSTPDIKHNIEEVQNDKAELEKQTKEAEQKFNLSGAKQQLESEKINQEHVKNKTANLTGNEKLVGEDGNVYSLASKTEAENRVKEAQANLDKTNANISSYTASAKNDLEDSHKGLAKSIGHGAAKSLGGAGLAAAGAAAAKIADKIEEKKKAKRELGKKIAKGTN